LGQATGQVLVYAVGIAISPVSIIGVVLMLGTPRARSTGPAFLLGWVAGLAAAVRAMIGALRSGHYG
jgi:hypothetical protein